MRLWNADKLASTARRSTGLTDYVYAVAFSPDGELVAGGGYDGEVRVWKVADGSVVKAFNASPGYRAEGGRPEQVSRRPIASAGSRPGDWHRPLAPTVAKPHRAGGFCRH